MDIGLCPGQNSTERLATSESQAAPKRWCGAPRLFCLCHPGSGGVPGRVPRQARSSSLREQVKKLGLEKAWLAAELGLGFRAPNFEPHFHLSGPVSLILLELC